MRRRQHRQTGCANAQTPTDRNRSDGNVVTRSLRVHIRNERHDLDLNVCFRDAQLARSRAAMGPSSKSPLLNGVVCGGRHRTEGGLICVPAASETAENGTDARHGGEPNVRGTSGYAEPPLASTNARLSRSRRLPAACPEGALADEPQQRPGAAGSGRLRAPAAGGLVRTTVHQSLRRRARPSAACRTAVRAHSMVSFSPNPK